MVRPRFAVTALASLALLALTVPASAAESGRAIVQRSCARCHAIGRTDASPHPGAPPLRRIGDSYNLDEFARLLRTGRLLAPHPDMPPFRFDRASAQAITRYLRSIQE